MVVYGLTGGIATGKSTVSNIFRDHGFPVIDADLIAREVVQPGTSAYGKLRAEFGPEFFDDEKGGVLIREKLGKLIFSDSEKRRKLNSITHPAIRWTMFWRFMYYFFTSSRYIILDTPLLFEVGYDKILNKVIVVWCDADKELERLIGRDGITEEEAQAKISSQMSVLEKKERANIVIDNNGNKDELYQQVKKLIDDMDSSWTPMLTRAVIPFLIASIVSFAAFRIF